MVLVGFFCRNLDSEADVIWKAVRLETRRLTRSNTQGNVQGRVGMHFQMLPTPSNNSRAPILYERHALFSKSSSIQLRECACLPSPFSSIRVFVASEGSKDAIACFFDLTVLPHAFRCVLHIRPPDFVGRPYSITSLLPSTCICFWPLVSFKTTQVRIL